MSEARDGQLSPLQERTRDALAAACEAAGMPAPTQHLKLVGTSEPYLTGVLADGRQYWIYTDGVGIEDQRLEEWDFLTPEELIAEFLAGVSSRSGELAP